MRQRNGLPAGRSTGRVVEAGMVLARAAARRRVIVGVERSEQLLGAFALLFQVETESRFEAGCLALAHLRFPGWIGHGEIPSPTSVSACQTEKGWA